MGEIEKDGELACWVGVLKVTIFSLGFLENLYSVLHHSDFGGILVGMDQAWESKWNEEVLISYNFQAF